MSERERELLAALKEAVEYIWTNGDGDCSYACTQRVTDRLNAVIAKAETKPVSL